MKLLHIRSIDCTTFQYKASLYITPMKKHNVLPKKFSLSKFEVYLCSPQEDLKRQPRKTQQQSQ